MRVSPDGRQCTDAGNRNNADNPQSGFHSPHDRGSDVERNDVQHTGRALSDILKFRRAAAPDF